MTRRPRLFGLVMSVLCMHAMAARAQVVVPVSRFEEIRADAHWAFTGALDWASATVAGLPEAARQGSWEVAYMFGFNSTKAERAPIIDEPIAADAALPVLDPPARIVASANPPSVPTVLVALPPVAMALPPAPPPADKVDRGLLANFVFDRGNRRPDGSFFVPKSLQRLFDVRVAVVSEADIMPTMRMTGRIIGDPRAHGVVQAGLMGRLQPPEAGFPLLGASVAKGDLLGYVVPSVGVVDRTQVRREIARLTTEIRVETENLEILKQFRFVPFRDGKIYQSEQRLIGLRRERAALLPLLQTQEALRAPVDGVISVARALSGRLVQAGEAVYEIVSPTEFWVEAMAPDPTMAATRPAAASAVTPEGQILSLAFIGSGLALQQQSTPMIFRITSPPAGLRIGRPVSIVIQGEGRAQRGIQIIRESLTLGGDGVPEVWEQVEPEIFQPRVVRTQEIDGASLLVVDGLSAGARIVVRGGRLMAQLQ